jgi:hypothetical protein
VIASDGRASRAIHRALRACSLGLLATAIPLAAAAEDPPASPSSTASPAPSATPPSAPAAASSALPPPSPRAPAPRAASADAPAEVILRVADPRAILERRPLAVDKRNDLPGVDGWVPVCIAPCGVRVDRTERLRVAGSGVDPSDGFFLPKGPGPFVVSAETGSAASHTAGLTLVVTGAGLLGLGGFTLLGLQVSGATKSAGDDSFAAKLQVASISTLILSGVVIAIAAPFRFGQRTTVQIDPARPAKAAPALRFVAPGVIAF